MSPCQSSLALTFGLKFVYDAEDVNVCPVREGTSTSKWNRGISLHVDSGKRDWHVVFDQARFLDGFILPAERIPSDISSVGDELEGEEETDSGKLGCQDAAPRWS